MPLSHRQGRFSALASAASIRSCVELMASSVHRALAGHVQKQCKDVSGAVPHLGHIGEKEGEMLCTRAPGHMEAERMASSVHLRG